VISWKMRNMCGSVKDTTQNRSRTSLAACLHGGRVTQGLHSDHMSLEQPSLNKEPLVGTIFLKSALASHTIQKSTRSSGKIYWQPSKCRQQVRIEREEQDKRSSENKKREKERIFCRTFTERGFENPNSKIIRLTNARSALMSPIAKVFQPQPLPNDVQPTQPNPGKKVPKRRKNPGKERERGP
jgi:hypothetical protein